MRDGIPDVEVQRHLTMTADGGWTFIALVFKLGDGREKTVVLDTEGAEELHSKLGMALTPDPARLR